MADFTYSPETGRYRGSDGKLVGARAVRDAVDRAVDEASDRLAALAERLRSGEITLAEWQTRSMAVIKDAHVAAGLAAHGGRTGMDQATYGALGHRIRGEYAYLRGMAREVADGTQPLDGRLAARARLYGQSGRATFTLVERRDQQARGATYERSIMSAAEHCSGCQDQAALGWRPVGTLIPPGGRQCRSSCRCRLAYSFKDEVAA